MNVKLILFTVIVIFTNLVYSAEIGQAQKEFSLANYARSAEFQRNESFRRILVNLSYPGVPTGAVIASWSISQPNYFYHWTRDAALTMRVLIDSLNSPNPFLSRAQLEQKIWNWLAFEALTQKNAGPENLGEPKYNVDGTVYAGPWEDLKTMAQLCGQ